MPERLPSAPAVHTPRICHVVAFLVARTRELLGDHLKGVAAIEVVGIDYGKRLLDGILAHEHSVVGAPGFGAVGGAGVTLGKIVDALEHYLHGDVAFVFLEDDIAEVVFKILADHKHNFAESGLHGVVDRIVHDGFAVRAKGVELLETAVARAHACSKYKECRFHLCSVLE